MNDTIDLTKLFSFQKELDQDIIDKHHVTYSNTRNKRLLALYCEVSECLNETRIFKYWSFKKPSEKSIILEEYVDGLHFLLSLGIDLDCQNKVFPFLDSDLDLCELFLNLYQDISLLRNDYNEDNYRRAFITFLTIGKKLEFSKEDIYNGYLKKLEINFIRQKENY